MKVSGKDEHNTRFMIGHLCKSGCWNSVWSIIGTSWWRLLDLEHDIVAILFLVVYARTCAIIVVQLLESWMMMQCVHSSLSNFSQTLPFGMGMNQQMQLNAIADCWILAVMPSCFESHSDVNVWAAVNLHMHSLKCTTVFKPKYFQHWCQWAYCLVKRQTQGILYLCVLCFIPTMLVITMAIGPQRVL